MKIHSQPGLVAYELTPAEVKAALLDYVARKDPALPAKRDTEISLTMTGMVVVSVRALEGERAR